jgi:uncharacterized protein
MFSQLVPRAVYDSVWDVDLDHLMSLGVKAILIDLDNTLVEYRKYETNSKIEAWVRSVKAKGLSVCVLSNSRRNEAVADLAGYLGIPAISRAGKPRRGSFIRAMELLGTVPENTAMVGDQIFTDVYGGNRVGCYTVLVRPLTRNEFFGTKISRFLEGFVLRSLSRRS